MTTLADLALDQSDWVIGGNPQTRITDLEYDSRLVAPGSLFVALRGGYADGHDFAVTAIANGAVALMVEVESDLPAPQIIVPDSRAALAVVADRFYGHPSGELNVIGITGTDGKTTTSYIVDHILRSASRKTGMIGTVSVRIGDETVDHETRQTTPESADIQRLLRQMVEAGVTDAVVEATSHGLDLHRLDNVRFAIGVVTNITHEHLEHHITVENYWRAKGRLFERVSDARGIAVVNLDDEGSKFVLPYADGSSEVVTYSLSDPAADLRFEIESSGLAGSAGQLVWRGRAYPGFIPFVGAFNVSNSLAALGAAYAAGIEIKVAIDDLATAPGIPGRMTRIEVGQPFGVIVDYAHTPESLQKVLVLLRDLISGGRLIAVFGSAGERDTTKRPIQGRIGAEFADISIFTNEDPRYEDADAIVEQIANGARAVGGTEGETFHRVIERREAIALAISLARPGDTILLAGKGHERSIIWNGVKHPWDEATVARDELAKAGWS